MFKLHSKQFQGLITLIGLLFFVPFLGGVHLFDWDEINFAESAREMLVSGNYWQVQVNFEPFWEKPPLFFWFQAFCMKIFGVNEFAARLPNALIGILSLNLLYSFGRKLVDDLTGRWWSLIYLASITPQFYFHSGIIDPMFNLFIFLTVIQLYIGFSSNGLRNWLLAGVFLGLAVLTKGPAAGLVVLLVLLTIWVRNSFRLWFKLGHFVLFGLVTLGITSLWFLPEIIRNGSGFISNFIAYQIDLMRNPVASHGQPWFYHPLVLLVGCFPASVLALRRFGRASEVNGFEFWMKAMFWVVLILFSLITTKIVHYSSLCYFPLTFLAALRLKDWYENDRLKRWEKLTVGLFSVIWIVIFVMVPWFGYRMGDYHGLIVKYVNDDFTRLNLSIDTGWSIFHLVVGGLALFIVGGFGESLVGSRRLMAPYWLLALAAYLTLFSATVVPKVERHTQGELIDFYETLQGNDCYVDVYKFKSYAHYFYTRVNQLKSEDGLFEQRKSILTELGVDSRIELMEGGRKEYKRREMDWLMNGDIDKPVYLTCQVKKAPELMVHENFQFLGQFGGYFVFKRQN